MDSCNDRLWRHLQLLFLLAALISGVGCTAPLSALPEARPLGRDLPRARLARSAERPPSAAFREPEGQLSLAKALSAALENSPRLEAFDWRVRAQEARALQAGLVPNPGLVIEGENFAGSGGFSGYDAAETTVFLGQLVELGGKRARRHRVADLGRELAGWDYEAARLDVLTETTQRFVAALAARERLALTSEILRVSRESLKATQARVRAGAASSIEQARSEVVVATIAAQRDRRQVEFDGAKRALASSWAGEVRFKELTGDLTSLRVVPSLRRMTDALAENPDLARWTTEIAQREAAVDLARARAIPNVTAGLGVRHLGESDDAALVFGLEVPIPVFDRNQGARAAATAEARRARALARESRLILIRALVAAHAEALGAHGNAEALASTVLPQAETAYEQTRDAYRKGLFRLVDVLDAQRTLFDARTEYVNTLQQFHAAAAEVERLVGSSLEDLSNGSN